MSIEVKVPQLPESVSDATLLSWHKKAGQEVARDENLVDLETDKVVLEVPAPVSGTLKEIRIADGATVTSGEILAVIEEGAVAVGEPAAEQPPKTAEAGVQETADKPAAVDDAEPESREAAHKLSPAVRRMLEEHDLESSVIDGTGKDGRLTKADVMNFLKTHEGENITADDSGFMEPAAAAVAVRQDERVPMTRLRARIAERLVAAQQTAAMLTTFNEVDLTEVMALRSRYKDAFEKEYGVRLGFMSFFVRASVEALRKFPEVNASVEGQDIVYHNYQDIGIAVSSDRGLLVPILRDAGQLSFAEIEQQIADYGRKARDATISIEELTGGTFTITNGGIFGSMMSTPILNPPQSAILGMHAIQQRPVAIDGKVEIRPMMYLAVTYDHRIIDGKEAVQFLVTIKQLLEDPARLLLQL
jgi:2-oxoglutarate dehydrogenase E2 component (dihydrolipoamide succinyltransferase)